MYVYWTHSPLQHWMKQFSKNQRRIYGAYLFSTPYTSIICSNSAQLVSHFAIAIATSSILTKSDVLNCQQCRRHCFYLRLVSFSFSLVQRIIFRPFLNEHCAVFIINWVMHFIYSSLNFLVALPETFMQSNGNQFHLQNQIIQINHNIVL